MTSLLDTALALHAQGYTPLPINPNGTKTPAVRWAGFTDAQPSIDDVRGWFERIDTDGLGVVTGAASGNLEMFELEGRAVAEGLLAQLVQAMRDHGAFDLWQRLDFGWVEMTPGSGMHWHYRVSDGPARPNVKLARRPATAEELADKPRDKVKVLIETRGQGGFTVIAPSAGRTHATGAAWVTVKGGPGNVPLITTEERDLLHAVANLLDQTPVEAPFNEPRRNSSLSAEAGTRPGDDYNQRASWDGILTGWTRVRRAGFTAWRRPGKDDPGISATTGRNDADNLYVFSSSTEFDTEKPYSKFAAYTLLEHGGDYSAAAKALAAQGYGAEPHRTARDDLDGLVGPAATPPAEGSLAPVFQLPTAEPRVPLELITRTLERSDDGNALALIDAYGDRLRYCSERGRWLAWDGVRWHWQPSNGGEAREHAKRVARSLPETDSATLTHKRRSLGAVGTSAMLTQAATDDRVTISIDQLDAHPWELNTPNGIVNLVNGTLTPPDPAKLHTRITTCSPDPDADPTRWTSFLQDTFGDDADLIAYLKRLVGYSAVGLVGPHVLPFCHGSGGNGKGAFLEAVQKVLGDYATTAPAGFLMARAHAGHETEIARLAGARMVLCSEVNEDDHFDEAKVKQLTGGDTLTARFMRADHFSFTPTHQLWLMGNSQPAVRSGGRAFWRRLRLIPFEKEVPEERQVDDLQGLLAEKHGPALLNWIVAGAVDYAAAGLREPATVKVATAEYAHDQDTVARFLEERCVIGGAPHVQLKAAIVRTAYERWCGEAGELPVTAKAFGLALRRKGIDTARTMNARLYVGIALTAEENASSEVGNTSSRESAEEWWA